MRYKENYEQFKELKEKKENYESMRLPIFYPDISTRVHLYHPHHILIQETEHKTNN